MTTVDFTHGYTPPGVYIEEDPTPQVNTTGLPPTRVAIIGRSAGFQTNTEQVSLNDTSVRLAKQGIDANSIVVTLVSDGSTLEATQYTTNQVHGSTTATQDYYLDFSRAGSAAEPSGTPVFVSYDYTTPDYFVPQVFDNFEDVKAAFGAPLNLSAQALGDTTYKAINSPLSLAAQIAFQNGATELVLCAANIASGATSGQIRTAINACYAEIATDYSAVLVVPLTDGITDADAPGVGLDLMAHISSTSNDGYFRTGVLGLDTGLSSAPDTLVTTGGFKNKRILLAYAAPGGLQFYNGNANQTIAVGHQYLAAAYAGRMAALPVQKSLTHEQINSFAGIAGTPLSNALKNQYAAAGVAVTEIDRIGRMIVRHGCTTDKTNINTAEASVVRARDAMVTLLQTGTDSSGLIGQPIDDNTPLSVKSVVAGLLEHCKSTGVIVDYANLAVRQTSNDPSVIEVKFAYRPAYPLNYIVISFSIDVSTGNTDLTTAAA